MADSAAGWKAGLCLLSIRGVHQALRRPGCWCSPEAGPAHSVPVEVPGKFCLPLISSSGLGANTNADRLDGRAVLPSVPPQPWGGCCCHIHALEASLPTVLRPSSWAHRWGPGLLLALLHYHQVPQGFYLPQRQHAVKGPFQCFFLAQSLPPPSPKNQSSPRKIFSALDRLTDKLPGATLPASRHLGHSAQHGWDPAETLLL